MSGFDELRRFAEDLGKVAGEAVPEAEAVLKKGAHNIKQDMIKGARSSRHFKGVAPSITYNTMGAGSLKYEIGPEVGRAGGSLGHIYYLGDSRGGGGTGDLDGPLRREEPNLREYLGKVVDKWAEEL